MNLLHLNREINKLMEKKVVLLHKELFRISAIQNNYYIHFSDNCYYKTYPAESSLFKYLAILLLLFESYPKLPAVENILFHDGNKKYLKFKNAQSNYYIIYFFK